MVQIIEPVPNLASALGTGLGSGLGKALQGLAEGKVKAMENRQSALKNTLALKSADYSLEDALAIGASPEMSKIAFSQGLKNRSLSREDAQFLKNSATLKTLNPNITDEQINALKEAPSFVRKEFIKQVFKPSLNPEESAQFKTAEMRVFDKRISQIAGDIDIDKAGDLSVFAYDRLAENLSKGMSESAARNDAIKAANSIKNNKKALKKSLSNIEKKPLTNEVIDYFLAQTNGDPAKAKEIALQNGYEV